MYVRVCVCVGERETCVCVRDRERALCVCVVIRGYHYQHSIGRERIEGERRERGG